VQLILAPAFVGGRRRGKPVSSENLGPSAGASSDREQVATKQPKCLGLTKRGEPCGATPTSDGRFCAWHSARYSAEQRKAWAARGGLSVARRKTSKRLATMTPAVAAQVSEDLLPPKLDTSENVRLYLERTVQKVEAGELAPSVANSITALLGLAIKLGELRLAADLATLEAELKERR
jgi:hypothetical protein